MIKKILLLILFFSFYTFANGQDYKFRDNIDKDSLFDVSIKRLPEGLREEYENQYTKGNEQEKEFLLFMISMPVSSKKELIENYVKNKDEIIKIKTEYSKLIPDKYFVYIEFEPASKILSISEQITIRIYKIIEDSVKAENEDIQRSDNLEVVSQNWNLKPDSKELEELIASIGWTKQTLTKIKEFLDRANCISIENGEITTIGFARSGMGKYSYKIFNNELTEDQKQRYNNGCEYIFYKDNIVLEYGGGAIGPQCFEKD